MSRARRCLETTASRFTQPIRRPPSQKPFGLIVCSATEAVSNGEPHPPHHLLEEVGILPCPAVMGPSADSRENTLHGVISVLTHPDVCTRETSHGTESRLQSERSPSNPLKDRAQTLVRKEPLKPAMGQSPDSGQKGPPQTSHGTESRL